MDYSQMEAGREMDALITTRIISNDGFWHGVKPYSTDIAAAYEMEQKIFDDGKSIIYMMQLSEITGFAVYKDLVHCFGVAHATPAQRCRAALMAAEKG